MKSLLFVNYKLLMFGARVSVIHLDPIRVSMYILQLTTNLADTQKSVSPASMSLHIRRR